MKITSSVVQLSSQHQKQTQDIERENLRVWIDSPGKPARQPAEQGAARFISQDQVALSSRAQQAQPVKKTAELEEDAGPIADTKMQALVQMLERMTGKKLEFFDPAKLRENQSQPDVDVPAQAREGGSAGAGFGIEYDYYSARIEQEQTSFQAQGIVKTADGKEINIQLELNMSRRFMEEQSISFRAGDAIVRPQAAPASAPQVKDPLVLNFDGGAAELSDTKFSFDIDSDGRQDQISLLQGNSAYLALDKNGDGIVNNGSELFGAQSGNGFADLAAYDDDGNNWIDENDSVYDNLRVWTKDAEGNDQLFALGQKDVGAIYLGNVSTPFDITNADNELQGQVASAGLFLKDSGGAGTVQQVNLVV